LTTALAAREVLIVGEQLDERPARLGLNLMRLPYASVQLT
jgi:hypothetical protein